MNQQGDFFTPEQAEEQIKELSHSVDTNTAHDSGARELVAALHQLYSPSARDQQSVDLAWKRLLAEVNSGDNTPFEENGQPSIREGRLVRLEAERSVMRRKSFSMVSTWQRLGAIAAMLVIAVLLSSAVITLHISQPQSGGYHAATPASLGNSLDKVSLGMTWNSLVHAYGHPFRCMAMESAPPNERLCIYLEGLGDPAEPTYELKVLLQPEVKAISVFSNGPPFPQIKRSQFVTAEGFRLGMSLSTFRQLYQRLTIVQISARELPLVTTAVIPEVYLRLRPPALTWFGISDTQGRSLIVGFDQSGQSLSMTLQTNL